MLTSHDCVVHKVLYKYLDHSYNSLAKNVIKYRYFHTKNVWTYLPLKWWDNQLFFSGKVIFTYCLFRDEFCQKYFWNPEYFTRVLMNFLIISSISVKQLNITEVHHGRDALLNFMWKCLLCNLQQLQCLLVKTITG